MGLSEQTDKLDESTPEDNPLENEKDSEVNEDAGPAGDTQQISNESEDKEIIEEIGSEK